MANFCLLHQTPAPNAQGFAAFAARKPEAPVFFPSGRAKIWELSPHLHCSIIGTCLSAPELRQIFARAGDAQARTPSDHALHGWGVRAASRRELGGKLIQKALDKRHEAAIRRFGKARTSAELSELWRAALDNGEISGAYWALLTHPAAETALVQDVFGDVHMLSHQIGAAARLDIARLRRLEADLAERNLKIERQQARLEAAAHERARMCGEAARLETELNLARLLRPLPPTNPSADVDLADLRRRLADEGARAEALAGRLAASEAARARAEAEAREARREAADLARELAALEAEHLPRAAPESADFSGRCVLYVGGRPKLIDQLQAFVAERGGALKSHDGGVDDSLALLPGLISQADAVVFPVDCVSHSAAEKVKTHCRRLDKPFAPLRSASLASFIAEFAEVEFQTSESRVAQGA